MKTLGCGKFTATMAALTALTHCFLAVLHGGPVAVPDVSAYLSVAQWSAGGVLPDPLHFFPGYGIILTPLGWLPGNDLHTVALIVNALLAGGCVIGAASLAQSYEKGPFIAGVATLVAVLHPSLSTSSRIAWPETVLTAVLLTIALLLRKRSWLLASLIAGLSLAIHPRAIVIVIALAVLGALARRVRTVSGGLTIGVLISGLCVYMTGAWPWTRIDAATSPRNGYGLAETISGQWIAITATSGALASIGLVVAIQTIWKRPELSAETFLALSALGMITLGGIALAGSERADTLLYGRYIGPWVVPLTVLGLVAIHQRRVTRQSILTVATLTMFSFGVVLVAAEAQTQGARRIMTLGLGAIWWLFDGRLIPTLFVAASVAFLGLLSARKCFPVPIAIVVALAISSTVSNHHHLHKVGEIADGQAASSQLVPDAVSCLSHDVSAKSYALWLYRLQLPDIDHVQVDIAAGERPCSNYVVATDHLRTHCPEAKLLGDEPRAKWSMWEYPAQSCS